MAVLGHIDNGYSPTPGGHRNAGAVPRVTAASAEPRSIDGPDHRAGSGGPDLDARLAAAHDRDAAADERDRQAARRDRLAAAREHETADGSAGARYRQVAAADRELAARDRLQAAADREWLAQQVVLAETDALTGAHTRAAGLRGLDREVARAGRDGTSLVVAYVDVVGLKRVNDTLGHVAGDELLQRVVAHVRAQLRPYDLIVRMGGDEFLCVLAGAEIAHVRGRLESIAATLAVHPASGGIRAGLAQLEAADRGCDLVARADRELLAHVHRGNGNGTH